MSVDEPGSLALWIASLDGIALADIYGVHPVNRDWIIGPENAVVAGRDY
jgi:hypothetical protein